MAPKLHLHLFGPPQFTYQGKPVTGFFSDKARALLIYLALTASKRFPAHPRPTPGPPPAHSRDALATKRENLRKALSNPHKLDSVTLIKEAQHLGHNLRPTRSATNDLGMSITE